LELSSAASIAYTSASAFGFHGSRAPVTVLIAAARFRATPLTRPKEPPKYRLVPPIARVFTR
jgi:hypothetical protein